MQIWIQWEFFTASEQKTQSGDSSNTKKYEINLHNRV